MLRTVEKPRQPEEILKGCHGQPFLAKPCTHKGTKTFFRKHHFAKYMNKMVAYLEVSVPLRRHRWRLALHGSTTNNLFLGLSVFHS
jgi:hypothetical protein